MPRDNKQRGLSETRWQQISFPRSLDSSSHAVFTHIKSTDFVPVLPLLSSLSSHTRTLCLFQSSLSSHTHTLSLSANHRIIILHSTRHMQLVVGSVLRESTSLDSKDVLEVSPKSLCARLCVIATRTALAPIRRSRRGRRYTETGERPSGLSDAPSVNSSTVSSSSSRGPPRSLR